MYCFESSPDEQGLRSLVSWRKVQWHFEFFKLQLQKLAQGEVSGTFLNRQCAIFVSRSVTYPKCTVTRCPTAPFQLVS